MEKYMEHFSSQNIQGEKSGLNAPLRFSLNLCNTEHEEDNKDQLYQSNNGQWSLASMAYAVMQHMYTPHSLHAMHLQRH